MSDGEAGTATPGSTPGKDDPATAEHEESPSPDEQQTADDSGGLDEFGTDRATRLLRWAGVVVLAVTAAVALAGFYNGVNGTIRVFVAEPYRPAFRAAFNLALLLVALGGIGLLVRRSD